MGRTHFRARTLARYRASVHTFQAYVGARPVGPRVQLTGDEAIQRNRTNELRYLRDGGLLLRWERVDGCEARAQEARKITKR